MGVLLKNKTFIIMKNILILIELVRKIKSWNEHTLSLNESLRV